MKLKGPWSADTTYSVGDVVTHSDGFVYHLQKPCKAGTQPIDTMFWGKLSQVASGVVNMMVDLFSDLYEKVATIPNNIDGGSISLKSGDNEYLITVDDSGETPELAVELIEEEGDGD